MRGSLEDGKVQNAAYFLYWEPYFFYVNPEIAALHGFPIVFNNLRPDPGGRPGHFPPGGLPAGLP